MCAAVGNLAGLVCLSSYAIRTGQGVWENQMKRYRGLQWMRRAEKDLGEGLNMVLVLGRAVGR